MHNSKLCTICMIAPVVNNIRLKCDFQVCSSCLVNWIETKAGLNFIPIMNEKFERVKEKADCTIPSDDQAAIECFSLAMLNIVAMNGADYRKCPKSNCNYIGTIDLKPCREMLQCNRCDHQWEDPVLYSCSRKAYLKIRKLIHFEFVLLNDIQKVIRGEPCPNCGICIIKLSGCNHMVCSKCNYEFCWSRLGHYPGYVHTDTTYCAARQVILFYFIAFFLVFAMNTKICFTIEVINTIKFHYF